MDARERYEYGLFTLRFTGEALSLHGVAIYDLSHCLLAIQRIVHKADLAINDRLAKGAYPDRETRQKLALQIGERRRASDAYALVPVLADPLVQSYLLKLADYVAGGLVGYFVGDVIDRLRREKRDDMRVFIGAIYTEVANIVNRVEAAGGVEAISLGAPALQRETLAVFDARTKDYVSQLKGEYFLGTYQEIRGRVYKLYPASRIVAIRRSGGRTVSIFLSAEDFDRIRYLRETSPMFAFNGRPRYRFGVETKAVSEFEADAVEYIPEDE